MFDLMPFGRNEKNMFRYLDEMEKHFFGEINHAFSQFRTDILDQGDHYELNAELPGFKKEEIQIDVNDQYLRITAQHEEKKEEKRENEYVCRERRYGSYSRSFDITGIRADGIRAAYQNGVLSLVLPKEAEKQIPPSRQIAIE